MMSTHGRKNSPPRILATSARRHRHAVVGHVASRNLFAALGVDDGNRGVQDGARADHRAAADARALDDHAAAADEGVVFDHDGHRVRRLEHAADADAARRGGRSRRSGRSCPPSPRCRPCVLAPTHAPTLT